jgi:hypothetical protein
MFLPWRERRSDAITGSAHSVDKLFGGAFVNFFTQVRVR